MSEAPSGSAQKPRARFGNKLWLWGGLGLLVAIAVAIAGMVGYWGGQHNAAEKINDRYVRPMLEGLRGNQPRPDSEEISWRRVSTHLHQLDIARISLSPRGEPAIWALAEVGDNLLFATRLGKFGFMDASNRFHTLDLQVPMGLEDLRKSPLYNDPVFQLDQVRTFDLLAVPTGPGAYDLFVSHNQFMPQGCFEHVVSRARLRVGPGGVEAVSKDWEQIYVARPCIEVKNVGMRFAGHEGGGRLVRLNNDTILLSLGAYQFDDDPHATSQNPANDLGKIIEISVSRHTGRIFALGLRNPQGLLVDSGGRIWETEHGPKGGDEVNIIRRGGNYGWPIVTYGMAYAAPPNPWPFNTHQGQHIGYTLPAFAFVPSVGLSNIIETDSREFPLWDTHLLVESLSAGTLYSLKVEGDRIVYAEPIQIGERMRDMIQMHDGRIAIITDSGYLIFIRNGELHASEPRTFTISGMQSLPTPFPDELEPSDKLVSGARVFHYYCSMCHTVTGDILAGPPLNGVLSRRIGAYPNYPYSEALSGASGNWNRGRLRAFLNHTDARLSGTAMPPVPLYDDQYDVLIAYLRTTTAGPPKEAEQPPAQ